MRIEFSAEVRPDHWLRVALDEHDLTRLLVEAEADVRAQGAISTTEVYYLLNVECERLMLAKLIAQYKFAGETVERLKEVTSERERILRLLRDRFPRPSQGQ